MLINKNNISLTFKTRILFCVLLFEFLLFVYSGMSFSGLNGNNFFSINADPVFWLFYLPGIPQTIIAQQWLGISLDILIFVLLLLFIKNPYNNKTAIGLFILMLLFYTTVMGYHAHRNYQAGFVFAFVPFMFAKESNKSFGFEAIRYFMLFFYVSAAVLKITSYAFHEQGLFSHLLASQFTPYYLDHNTGLRTSANIYLVNHPSASHALYIFAIILELAALIGFFTKKFDRQIAILILTFHFSNWFLMDIAPFGQIAFVGLLFLSRDMKLPELK